MIHDVLRDEIRRALISIGLPPEPRALEYSARVEWGDVSSNIALVAAARRDGRNPRNLADALAAELSRSLPHDVDRVEVADPGFINFFLSRDFFARETEAIIVAGDSYGSNSRDKGKKVMVEYTDPNPFKVFHIGHLMTNVIGESLARLLEFSGAEVARANYQGDVGLHVAKAIWGISKRGESDKRATLPLVERIAEWGGAYTEGARAYDDNENVRTEIQAINRKIFDRSDPDINALYNEGRADSLEYFETIYKKLGTVFDFYFFESEVAEAGKRLVGEHAKRGVFEESDGALIFRGEKYGFHTRVFLTSQGLPLYEAKDLALAKEKYKRYPYDMSVVVTANEQNAYWQVVKKAMEYVFPELAEKTVHRGHGMLRFSSGKMSSRKGNVVTGESLLEDSIRRAEGKMTGDALAPDEKNHVAEVVGIGALKYSILRQAMGRDIVYDAEKSFSLDGDSGPYLQYTYARAHSLLEKARGKKGKTLISHSLPPTTHSLQPTPIERLLYRFPDVVLRAAREYEPHYVTTYLTSLAAAFNSFYAGVRIVSDEEESEYRIKLTHATAIVLKNGLSLLGIAAPERM